MPDVQEIEDKVIAIVSDQMGVEKAEISRETSFVNDLNADSLDTVELVMELEDEFEMSIPDEDAVKIQTVGQAIDYIKDQAEKASPPTGLCVFSILLRICISSTLTICRLLAARLKHWSSCVARPQSSVPSPALAPGETTKPVTSYWNVSCLLIPRRRLSM